jgi:hypothetical protein
MRAQLVLQLSILILASAALVPRAWASAPESQPKDVSVPATVQVGTDSSTYAVGDTVTVTVTNLGLATIMPRGGRVCDSFWPIRLEQQNPDGWTPVPLPQEAICAAASVVPYQTGEMLLKSFPAGPDAATYRAVFNYDVPGQEFGSLPPAYSDPFVVTT